MEQDYLKASDGTGPAALANITADRSIGATVLEVDNIENWSDEFIVTTGLLNANGYITPESMTQMLGHLDSGDIIIDGFVPGYSDNGNEEGQVAIIKQSVHWANKVAGRLVPAGAINAFAGAAAPEGWLLCQGQAVSRTTYADLYDVLGDVFGDGDGATTFNLPDLRSRIPVGADQGSFSFTFASTDVNTGTDQIAVTASEELVTGRKVQIANPGTLPTGIAAATDYYLIVVDSTHIKLATSLANAVAGTAIDITGAGAGTNTATGTLTDRDLGAKGGEEAHATLTAELPVHRHLLVAQETVGTAGLNNTNQIAYARNAGSDFSYGMDNGGSALEATYGRSGPAGSSTAHNNMPPFLALNYIIKT